MSDNSSSNDNETPGGGVVQKDDIEFEKENPNIARAMPADDEARIRQAVTPDEDPAGDE